MSVYAPSRDLLSKVRRRWTQASPGRPARLEFERPLLSICFDDFPASAVQHGARLLERYGACGTFFAAAGLIDSDGPSGRCFSANDITRLMHAGHEIGCHTFSHSDCARRDVFTTLQDIARNREAMAAHGCVPATSFAYPYGETSDALKQSLPKRFACARGVLAGLNRGAADLAQLRAYPLYGAGALTRAHGALKLAAKRNAWMIAFTHDVSDAPSPWGTRPQDLQALLEAARKHGVALAPISAAFARSIP